MPLRRIALFFSCWLFSLWFYSLSVNAGNDSESLYDINYLVSINPSQTSAKVTIELIGKALPSKLVFHLDPKRHQHFISESGLQLSKKKAIWQPGDSPARISYQFVIDKKKKSGSYDSKITDHWAILRTDKLIPPISVTADKRIASRASLALQLPKGWSSRAPYDVDQLDNNRYYLIDPGRRFIRPKGWLLLGELATRKDLIANVEVQVASPTGYRIRLQDTLAFINWNLPALTEVFDDFPQQLLVVMASDPMWLGGLSGPRSLFIHADRPLISGNRTSGLIHELVHVGSGIHGDDESDWIVEGLAEFYSTEILRRTGGISQQRFEETMTKLDSWGKSAPSLLVKRSSGAVTARAASLLYQIDQVIRSSSKGEASLDDVARKLAKLHGDIDLETFSKLVDVAAGKKVTLLERDDLSSRL